MVAVLLALTLFWDTERLARDGRRVRGNITANPQQLVTVTATGRVFVINESSELRMKFAHGSVNISDSVR